MTPLDLFPEPRERFCTIGGGSGGGGGGGITGNIYSPSAQPQMDTNWQNLLGALQNQWSAGDSPGQRWAPYARDVGQNMISNPYQGNAIGSADMAMQMQQAMIPAELGGAQALYNYGASAAPYGQNALLQGQSPAYGMAQNLGVGLAGGALPNVAALQGAGMQDLQTGYDPQNALYNRTQSRLSDQINSQLANQGLAGSPYGASVASNALGNFNLDWQDRQQQRQLAGGAGAAQMFGAQAQQGNAALGDILTPANAAGNAMYQGAGTYGSLGQSLQAGMQGSQSLGNQTLQQLATYGSLPYQQYNSVMGNDFGAIQNAVNLENTQYQLPQQLLGNLQSYMQLGQSANNLGAQNALAANAQMMQGLGGLGSLVGGMNNWGSAGSGGMLGSLFGGEAGGWGGSALGGADVGGALAGEGAGGGLLEALGAGAMSSDRRLKTNIKPVGKLDNGLVVYAYRYKDEPIWQIGLMADEVEKLHPEAVSTDYRGFKIVRYDLAVA